MCQPTQLAVIVYSTTIALYVPVMKDRRARVFSRVGRYSSPLTHCRGLADQADPSTRCSISTIAVPHIGEYERAAPR